MKASGTRTLPEWNPSVYAPGGDKRDSQKQLCASGIEYQLSLPQEMSLEIHTCASVWWSMVAEAMDLVQMSGPYFILKFLQFLSIFSQPSVHVHCSSIYMAGKLVKLNAICRFHR